MSVFSQIIKKLLLAFIIVFTLLYTPKAFAKTEYETLSALYNPSPNATEVIFFWSETCPHCKEEIEYFTKLKTEIPNISIKSYEITTNKSNADLLTQKSKELGLTTLGVPLTIVGDKYISGFGSPETTGKALKSLILGTNVNSKTEGSESISEVKAPLFGLINISKFSLPVLSIILGLIDGFNPCAMWVLLFLISVLFGIDDVKRRWILGLTFILISGLIYFLFMSAWLNFFLIVGFVPVIRLIVASFGVGFGMFSIYKFFSEDTGCVAEASQSRRDLFQKIRSFVNKDSLVLALLGISFLAMSVNALELLCSAGIPAIFTQTLAMSKLPTWSYYSYILLYDVFYMFDDILVFLIAMFTLQMVGISTSYTKYAKIIGGIIILAIGIIMIIDPGILSFN